MARPLGERWPIGRYPSGGAGLRYKICQSTTSSSIACATCSTPYAQTGSSQLVRFPDTLQLVRYLAETERHRFAPRVDIAWQAAAAAGKPAAKNVSHGAVGASLKERCPRQRSTFSRSILVPRDGSALKMPLPRLWLSHPTADSLPPLRFTAALHAFGRRIQGSSLDRSLVVYPKWLSHSSPTVGRVRQGAIDQESRNPRLSWQW